MTAPNTHPDQIYIDALLQNDRARIREIYSQHSARIKNYILRNNGNEADAADIFSEGLMAIMRRARKRELQLTCPFGAYLLLVCKSLWLNELKKRKRTGPVSQLDEAITADLASVDEAEKTAEEEARRKLFLTQFEKLADSCKEILKLSLEGIGMQDVAEKLGISYAYARKRKSNCTAKLIQMVQTAPEYRALMH